MTSDRVVSELTPPLWEEVLWLVLDAWDSVHLRTTSTQWNVQGRCGPYALFLPFEERADGPQGADSGWAQHAAAW